MGKNDLRAKNKLLGNSSMTEPRGYRLTETDLIAKSRFLEHSIRVLRHHFARSPREKERFSRAAISALPDLAFRKVVT